jgi:hypothetical protein
MSRKDKAVSKLIASLGVFSLVIGFCAPDVSAVANNPAVPAGSFSAANYSGRYGCVESTGPAIGVAAGNQGEFASAVMKIKPNGSGGYNATSTLSANDSAFGGSGTSFCSYTLTTGSFYTISGDGTGFEKLIWAASSSNEAICPASFTDLRAIALRNLINVNGVSIDGEFSSVNFLGQISAGHGYCLK